MSLYDSRSYPPLPSQPIKPVRERVEEAKKFRGQISDTELHTIIAAIYGSARDFGEDSFEVPQTLPPESMIPGLSKIPAIQVTVANNFNLTVGEMMLRRRALYIIRPRQIAMYLSRLLTPHSLPEIGQMFGGRDHGTVIHAVRKIEAIIAADAAFAEEIETLKGMLVL
jgi:hypothetical protein